MVRKVEDLRKTLDSLGYERTSFSTAFHEVYRKTEGDMGKRYMKLVVVAELVRSNILTNEGIDYLKQWACSQYENLSANDVLVIGLCDSSLKMLRANNLILMDKYVSKLYTKKFDEMFTAEFNAVKEYLKDTDRKIKHRKADLGPVYNSHTTAIVYAIIAVMLYAHFAWTNANGVLYGISAIDVFKNGESYRLISYLFTHGNLLHLVSNCFSLFLMGRAYAKRRNAFDFIIVFLGSGILSGIISISASMYFTDTPEKITVGASGAIFAMLGALVANVFLENGSTQTKKAYFKYAVIVIAMNLVGVNVDHVCHIGGFISGIILEYILFKADELHYVTEYIETRDKKRIRL